MSRRDPDPARGIFQTIGCLWVIGLVGTVAFWGVVIWGIVEAILWLRAQ